MLHYSVVRIATIHSVNDSNIMELKLRGPLIFDNLYKAYMYWHHSYRLIAHGRPMKSIKFPLVNH